MGYLRDHPDIAMRVSDTVRTSLAAQGQGDALSSLRTQFGSSAHNAASTQGDTVQSLLAQPYYMSRAEMQHLQSALYRSGHYTPTGQEEITRADNGRKIFRPDGTMGASVLYALERYRADHPETVIRNPTILNHLDRIGASTELRHPLVLGGAGQRSYINTLIRGVDQDAMSPTNYALQTLLHQGGVSLNSPDGEIGPVDREAITRFKTLRIAEVDPGAEATQLAANVMVPPTGPALG
jgi:hypothetical protein